MMSHLFKGRPWYNMHSSRTKRAEFINLPTTFSPEKSNKLVGVLLNKIFEFNYLDAVSCLVSNSQTLSPAR